jgi:hypothetical protein
LSQPETDMKPSIRRDVLMLVIGTLLGVAGTTAASLLTGWLQAREAVLVYEAKETLPLQDKERSTAIYEVLLDNHGNKEAEDVVCVVQIPEAKIERHGVSHQASMKKTEEVGTDTLTERFDAINPNDPVRISVLATSAKPLPTLPTVSVRGKGVLGIAKNSAEEKAQTASPWTGLFSQYIPILITPVICCLILSIYGLYSFIEKQLKIKFSKMKIELEFSTADRLKLRVGKSQDWITMLPGDRHEGSGYDYEEFRQMGQGEHFIHRK